MEKGLKTLNTAARKKQGTYDEEHGDSGIGHSDLDEEQDDRMPSTLSDIPESSFPYHPYSATQQRVPSIRNMLQYPGPNHPRHL